MAANPSPQPGAGSRGSLIDAPPRAILLFAARTLAWAVVFFAAWYVAAKPVSLATSWISARMLEFLPGVETARVSWRDHKTSFEVSPDTSLVFKHRLRTDMVVDMDVNTLKQTYGIPFFLALLAAARARRFAAKAALGVAILVVLAADGIASEVIIGFGMTKVAGGALPFAPSAWLGTLYALGLQLGTLIFPAVVPVVLVVAMERAQMTSPASAGPVSS